MCVCSSAVRLHVSMAPLPGCWNMVIVRSEYPCARSRFNESHLCHICTFIPLQGEIVFPKRRLPPRQQILMAYPRWLPVSSSHSEAVSLWEHMYEIYGMFAGLNRRREGRWNVGACCLWRMKGILQTWVHPMINSTANLSTTTVYIPVSHKDTIHLFLFH